MRVAASHQRDTEQIGSFLATFSRSSDNPFLNYAIPSDNATPSLADVNALIAAYEKRLRKPRLEYVAELAPAVKGVLVDAGFCVEGYLPLMTCTSKSAQTLPVPSGIGLIPKLFCRIRRLQQVLDLVSSKDQVDWTDMAIACGYFDQAHFIHDFRMFANCTPTEYLAQRGFHPCHVVLLD